MAENGQTYVGVATLVGVPAVGTLPGFVVFDMDRLDLHDLFRNAVQSDQDDDIVRVTPYQHQRVVTLQFMPFVADTYGLDVPEPGSLLRIDQRVGPPLPKMFRGDWRYIGPGTAGLTNTNAFVMTLTCRKCNPLWDESVDGAV